MTRDRMGRPLRSLRISVTDRCNMRCRYCMPETDYAWLPRSSILTFEETARLARIAASVGVDKIRITGGEPLLRHDLPELLRMLSGVSGIRELAMTTNGILLAPRIAELRSAGLARVTISLDTLRPERMAAFARSTRHADVLAGIDAARASGLAPVKVNSVIIRGYNDDEIEELVEFGRTRGVEMRFIEYMDVGGATAWRMSEVVSQREMLDRIEARYGAVEALDLSGWAPAERFRLRDGTVFGVIASTTAPFCRTCDRGRLTADGTFYTCLYADRGLDLRDPLRLGASDDELRSLLDGRWSARADRGAEQRAAASDRGALYQLESLRADPRREMHTRGG